MSGLCGQEGSSKTLPRVLVWHRNIPLGFLSFLWIILLHSGFCESLSIVAVQSTDSTLGWDGILNPWGHFEGVLVLCGSLSLSSTAQIECSDSKFMSFSIW
ncbi:hypothetical protein Csa_012178 [Cucumis sativus]|uniref:Uncharacterized protein n=1 Tax=Cucumis sativus TaxID=3659 RepID=A0A0A0L0R3_CUCSA|nr:hypothetical protein Csa_012178 [Cucumis sativus]